MKNMNIFAPVATRVLRVLLTNKKTEWAIYRLAKEADVSYGHTYRLTEALLEMGLCRRTEKNKIILAKPKELLKRWATYHNYQLVNEVYSYYSEEKDIDIFLNKIAEAGTDLKYALTLHTGANLVSPFVRPTDVHFYVQPEDRETWAKKLGLELIEVGGNIHLVEPYDPGVFYGMQKVNNQSIVSNVQLYVDLCNYPQRGREAAEHLFKRMFQTNGAGKPITKESVAEYLNTIEDHYKEYAKKKYPDHYSRLPFFKQHHKMRAVISKNYLYMVIASAEPYEEFMDIKDINDVPNLRYIMDAHEPKNAEIYKVMEKLEKKYWNTTKHISSQLNLDEARNQAETLARNHYITISRGKEV